MIVTQITEKAERVARLAHKGQIDRDGKPHFEHCERVAVRVAAGAGYEQGKIVLRSSECGMQFLTNTIVVAYLHDTLEDTALTYGEIEKEFGAVVATAVVALTHLDGEETYRQFIIRAARNPIARVVKIADIQDNLGRKDAKSFHKHDLYLWALDYLQNYHE